jgi:hypothetical protein
VVAVTTNSGEELARAMAEGAARLAVAVVGRREGMEESRGCGCARRVSRRARGARGPLDTTRPASSVFGGHAAVAACA